MAAAPTRPINGFPAPNERLDILDDLQGKYDLVGMTQEEAVALLGPEDWARADLLQGGPDALSPRRTPWAH